MVDLFLHGRWELKTIKKIKHHDFDNVLVLGKGNIVLS